MQSRRRVCGIPLSLFSRASQVDACAANFAFQERSAARPAAAGRSDDHADITVPPSFRRRRRSASTTTRRAAARASSCSTTCATRRCPHRIASHEGAFWSRPD